MNPSPIKNIIIALITALAPFLYQLMQGKTPEFPGGAGAFTNFLLWLAAAIAGWNVRAAILKRNHGAYAGKIFISPNKH